MTKRPEEHLLATEEEKLSPVIVIVTIALILLFGFALLYRLGVTIV